MPGNLIHIDETLARFRNVGHRLTGDRQQGRFYGVELYVAVEDATRLAYIEVLAVEQKPTVIGFLSLAVVWFNGQEIVFRQTIDQKRERLRLPLEGIRQCMLHCGSEVEPNQAYPH